MGLGAGPPVHGLAGLDRRRLVLPLLLYGAVPWLGYQLLTARHVPALTALCLLAVIPALGVLVQWVRTRRANVLGALSLTTILLGVAATLITGSPALLLARGSLISGGLGLACLVSASGVGGLRPLPLLVLRGRVPGGGEHPPPGLRFERVVRGLTVLWGAALVGEALVRVVIAFTLPAPTVLAISPLLLPAVVLPTAGLTLWMVRRARAAR